MWARFKPILWQWRGVWIATPTVAGIVILLRLIGVWQPWEWAAFDQYMRWRPLQPIDHRIAIVGINESDLQTLQQSIISDGVYAQLVEKLKAQQPRAIGLDIYRDLPVEPGHQDLVKVFESTPNLVGIQKVVGEQFNETVAPPPVLAQKGQVGANDLLFDADNTVRRSFIYVAAPDGETVYSFSLHLALHYLDSEGIAPEPIGDTNRWTLGNTEFLPFEANDGGYIGADARGFQLVLNYRGPRQSFETVSLMDVLEDRIPPDWGRDRIILIGQVSESAKDLYLTPYSGGLLDLPKPMAGVEIHAHLTSQIIDAAFGDRPLFKSLPEPLEWLWILLWSGIGAFFAWRLRYTGGVKVFSLSRLAGLGFVVVALGGSTYLAFLAGWWLPVVPPALALFGSVAAITAFIARSAGEIRKIFGRYLNDEVVAHVLENPEGLKLGGERRRITILTSDLRGFTALSERLSPEEVVKVLNLHLEYMAHVITQYQGTIDEFLGDGLLVLFGAPTSREDDAQRAVACAVAMQLAMAQVNATMQQWGLSPLEMGIGLNTGDVVLGNIGSEQRTKYGVIGSQVNLAYRIESYTIGGQIFISESTLAEAGEDIVTINSQKVVHPKGVAAPIIIYDIDGIGGTFNLSLAREAETFLPLPQKIPIRYAILEGKHIGEQMCQGYLVELSARGAKVQVTEAPVKGMPDALDNIKINLIYDHDQSYDQNAARWSDDIYAKALDKPGDQDHFYIAFTNKPPDVEERFHILYQSITPIAAPAVAD